MSLRDGHCGGELGRSLGYSHEPSEYAGSRGRESSEPGPDRGARGGGAAVFRGRLESRVDATAYRLGVAACCVAVRTLLLGFCHSTVIVDKRKLLGTQRILSSTDRRCPRGRTRTAVMLWSVRHIAV